jgi:hypothetical protein
VGLKNAEADHITNHGMFMTRMPSNANPRVRPIDSMRAARLQAWLH